MTYEMDDIKEVSLIRLVLIGCLILAISCKTATTPQPAECEIGYLPCEYDDTICCMDTTSHNFTWEIDTLGNYGSYLNDVWIVDENNIWVVGNIDTDSGEYNAARWDGSEWELELIVNPDPIKGIYYFSEDDIWMVNGYPMHWDGNEWTLYALHNYGMQVAVEHLWGTSSSNMYFVGLNGSIVHYDGSGFTQMESGTTIKLRSITVSNDRIWVTGYEDFIGTILLEYRDNSFETVYFKSDGFFDIHPDSLSGKTMAVWTNNPDSVNVLIPMGIYRVPFNGHAEARLIPNYWQGFPWSIGGNSDNDIFTGGDFSSVYHFNGSTYQYYTEFSGRISTQSINMKANIVCLAGEDYETGKAIIIRGNRQ